MSFDEMLDQNVAAHAHDPKQVQPGLISQFSDPQTVAAIAQQAAQTTLGRNLTTAEVKSFVAEFHQQEVTYNNSRKAAEATAATGKDAAVTSAPDATAAADRFVQQGSRGTVASGNKLADYVGVIRGLVSGNVTTPTGPPSRSGVLDHYFGEPDRVRIALRTTGRAVLGVDLPTARWRNWPIVSAWWRPSGSWASSDVSDLRAATLAGSDRRVSLSVASLSSSRSRMTEVCWTG